MAEWRFMMRASCARTPSLLANGGSWPNRPSATSASPALVGALVILAIWTASRATVLGMTAFKQLVFSLVFAIAAVAAAQYVIWILNGQP
jgi:hypothetical protein